jgi:hypothetical protein
VLAAEIESQRSPRRAARSVVVDCLLLGFISFVIALGVVLGTTFFHGDRVSNRAEVKHLGYGFPISWITQNQSDFVQTPRPPTTIGMGSPWHNPTSASGPDFLLDMAIVGAAPFSLYWIVVGSVDLSRRRRRAPRRLLTAAA